MSDYDRRLLRKLRVALLAGKEMSDEKVMKITKDTLMEAGVRMSIFMEDLAEVFRPLVDVILTVFLWITRRIQR